MPAAQALKNNFQPTILSYLPSPADTLQMVLLYKVLSAHAPNEEYLNNDQPEWIDVRLGPSPAVPKHSSTAVQGRTLRMLMQPYWRCPIGQGNRLAAP